MEKIIVYGSEYGATKRYAEALSEKTGIKAFSYTQINSLSSYNTIIYLGGLYAGGVLGLAKTVKRFSINPNQTLIIVTVGLADPKVQTNANNIRYAISKQIPQAVYDSAQIFHIRGGIDYQKLHFSHKAMMKLLYEKLKKLPPEQRDEEARALIATYNQKVDFVNFESLEEIIAVL